MKIQLRGQSMRLRIDESELKCLLDGNELVNTTQFGSGSVYRQTLRLSRSEQPSLEAQRMDSKLSMPEAWVRDYVSRLPRREGLKFTLPAGDMDVLTVTFEVDVRDSMRVRSSVQRERTCSVDLRN